MSSDQTRQLEATNAYKRKGNSHSRKMLFNSKQFPLQVFQEYSSFFVHRVISTFPSFHVCQKTHWRRMLILGLSRGLTSLDFKQYQSLKGFSLKRKKLLAGWFIYRVYLYKKLRCGISRKNIEKRETRITEGKRNVPLHDPAIAVDQPMQKEIQRR